ncbi:CinA family protein [Actinoplanes sp. NPDC051633]|uniref:CinA family protein n=1 Tax=Actinoplanes sp. NPDC051633 TaxID=3155670 RepID=UPI003417E002
MTQEAGVSAAAAVHRLVERRQTLATAESLTGGEVASTIVEIPGVSAVYRGGLVVYATDLKHALAGVPEELLAERGAVDRDVALALASGARERCGADWGLATTGVAGPDPQDGKPPGLVFVAVAGPGGAVAERLEIEGNRAAVRSGSVTAVLNLLVAQLDRAGTPA